ELGDGTMASRLEPARVLGVSDATAIASFFTHTCAVLRSGELRCWGENGYGQLGEGDNAPRLAPVTVIDITNGFQVSTGLSHTCVRLATGDVACWGANAQGQIGDGTMVSRRTTPYSPPGLSNVLRIA